MTPTNSLLRNHFYLRWAEIFFLFFVPVGSMQFKESWVNVEFKYVSHPLLLWSALGAFALISGLIAFIWVRKLGRGATSGGGGARSTGDGGGVIGRAEQLDRIFQSIVAFYLAFQVSNYGAAKIMQTQFQPPNYIMDTPVGELGGFWLTWTYYGHSQTMALILGITQVVGCSLLLFRLTRLLGVFILLPILVNIDLIDHFYKISPLANFNSMHFTAILVFLLLLEYGPLKEAFFKYRQKLRVHYKLVLLNILRMLVIAMAFVSIASLKSGFPPRTRINGVWKVDSILRHALTVVPGQGGDSTAWSKIYIEWRYGVVLKVNPGRVDENKDRFGLYEVDEKTQVMRVGLYDSTEQPKDSLFLHYRFVTDSVLRMQAMEKGDTLKLFLRRVK
jgi:hypothetical protein